VTVVREARAIDLNDAFADPTILPPARAWRGL